MIHAYAIEPATVVEWAKDRMKCKYIYDNFGLGSSAIMAEFPLLKNWRKQFRQLSMSLGDLEMERAAEMFKYLMVEEKTVRCKEYEYDGNTSWVENAEKQNKRSPFKAIIAENNPSNSGNVLLGQSVGEWPEKKWHTKRTYVIDRNECKMAEIMAPMLRKAKKIVFIDPYFHAQKTGNRTRSTPATRFLEPLKRFLQECTQDTITQTKKIIEVHTADKDNLPSNEEFKRGCMEEIPDILPDGISITFKRWEEKKQSGEKLHNRYILTDIGGVTWGIGLDKGDQGQTDDVSLLDRKHYLTRWKQYVGEPAFDLKDEFTVQR